MASYKSHYNLPRRLEEQTSYTQRAPSSRLPQRSVTPISSPSYIPAPSHSKLQKKRAPRDEQVLSSRGSTSHQAPTRNPSATVKARQVTTAPTVPISHSLSSMSVPKTARQVPSSRLPKPESIGNTATPSLASGSSASTSESPRSNLLKRKPSNIGIGGGRQASRGGGGSSWSQEELQPIKAIPGGYRDPFSETVLGISLPPSSAILVRSEVELDPLDTRYGNYPAPYELSEEVLPLPNPLYALSTTPSTRYSESPGPFSVSSTPTSMSSYSPGTALSSKSTTRVRQASPLESRPPVTRIRTNDSPDIRQQHALSSVRESSNSSSSASTIVVENGKSKEKALATRPGYLSPPQSSMPQFQAPPELAHLADLSQRPSTSRKPSRPSRDGTMEIKGLREPSPVIQSNMTSFPSTHRRSSSSDSKSGIVPNNRSRFGFPSKPSSRNPSPNPSMASGFVSVSRGPTPGSTPDLKVDSDQKRAKTLPSSAPSPGKNSRFGFFSRRTKTEPVAPTSKPEKKLQRKGPAAGTGHEGYGKYSIRGRSGSSTSVGSTGRSASAGTAVGSVNRTPSSRKSSMTSTTSTEMDDFFLERLTPVVIRGTGSSTELSRSPEPMHSSSSLDLSRRPSEEKRQIPTSRNAPIASPEQNRPTLLPSAMSDPVRSPVKRNPLGLRRPSESDDDSKRSFLLSLGSKRASRTSKAMDGAALKKIPTPVGTNNKRRNGSTASTRIQDDYVSDGKEGRWLQSKKTQSASSKPTKKWNFFQRAHGALKVESSGVDAANKLSTSKSVAHYALIDPKTIIDLEDIEKIMQEADSSSEDARQEERPMDMPQPKGEERLQSMLLPPRPILPPDFVAPDRPASPKVFLRQNAQVQPKLTINTHARPNSPVQASPVQPEFTPVDLSPALASFSPSSPVNAALMSTLAPESALPMAPSLPPTGPVPSLPPPRPSRLAQVGRIPQVVSRRNQERPRPAQSFSRPFIAAQQRPDAPSRTSISSFNSFPATAGPVEPYPILRGLDALHHGSAIATLSPSAEESLRRSEFFKFPPRKDSDVSYSSSSGTWNFPASCGTAIVPRPGAPQSEDEVWNEYDDLIDDVLSPGGSSKIRVRKSQMKEHTDSEQNLTVEQLRLNTRTSQSSIAGAAIPSLHLRRSRLLAVLHSSQSPTSPLSLSDFVGGYGQRNLSVVDPVTGRLSFPSSARMSAGSNPQNRPLSTLSSLPASLTVSARQSKATLASNSDKDRNSGTGNRYRDTRLMEMAETQADGLVSMANLRFGALMTSKWLTFGRVLFSPAHLELKNSTDRVLVIDGLGKDWSYYCALTYPEATIYNLGPGPALSAAPANGGAEPWSTLRNHRHISHASLASQFPFPQGYFACAVIRFPSALPSSVHRSVIAECKRVLRPGGYLELSVLDLDLVNMGNRARRAVRGLKVKLQAADDQVSLRNISDEVIIGLGRKGFTECNRCFVGIPVAGKLPSKEDGDGVDGKRRKGSNASTASRKAASKAPKPEVSFSDLLSAQSSSSTDDGITEMVARVGRWWYSRCYESLILPEAGESGAEQSGNLLDNSIWRDEALLRECEKRGTSFRLLIGYAQKPEVGVRRTVSV
ncbi:hypothetical protein GQ43DRAFT_361301 [Delitschia confertaspora ATCC 74209]|uniref:Methyltransferase type 11 domain-containing protein n=1 Tax=Delitschia confertaspora ATCC 74209 TaxID=1513339 RepID=A0A9P4JV45_9PLEO|nr:hypothetical protein GQ43DRAFT_361301 [Delitschia confertaspora ATCC 74209]